VDSVGLDPIVFVADELSFCVAALSSRLLSGVRSQCQLLQSLFFPLFFCFISIGHWQVLNVSVCSGVAFQAAHCIVSLKTLTAASISLGLRETFRVSLSLISCLKSSHFVCLLHRLGFFSWVSACVDSMMRTGE
jgi:hypothetical protein